MDLAEMALQQVAMASVNTSAVSSAPSRNGTDRPRVAVETLRAANVDPVPPMANREAADSPVIRALERRSVGSGLLV